MIRPFTCICVLLAAGSGLYLYQAKHRAQMLDREIEATMRATDAARERMGVLRAEWTLLNDPERLAQLAGRFLDLHTTQPAQFTTMAELANRLPPVRAVAPAPEPMDEPPDAGTPVDGTPVAADDLPLPPIPPDPPALLAAASGKSLVSVRAPARPRAPVPAVVTASAIARPMPPGYTPLPDAPPAQAGTPVVTRIAVPLAARAAPVYTPPPTQLPPQPQGVTTPATSSALGMARVGQVSGPYAGSYNSSNGN